MMMISFVMAFVFNLFSIFFNKKFFWVGLIFYVFLVMYFSMKNLSFSGCLFMGESLSVDLMSIVLVMLSAWLTLLMIFSSSVTYKKNMNLKLFNLNVMLLFVVLLITFEAGGLIMFYFFFEFSLLPTLFIILGWGYQPERVQAGIYFLFYTLTASLPLLLGVLKLSEVYGGSGFYLLSMKSLGLVPGLLVFMVYLLAFLVKMPMYFVHLWLPKAHVEAPVAGSMILAGVLLKLGGYGMYRVIGLCLLSVSAYGGYCFGLSILGLLYVGLICCRLNDIKALVAYSSVAHMGLVICGLLSFYFWGVTGAFIMMFAHGLSSSGLFCAVNIFYERSGSRSFFLNKGLLGYFPLFTFLFFILCIANIAAPPSINLAAELMLVGGLMKFDYLMLLFFPLGSYLGAVFTLFLFSYSQHGRCYNSLFSLETSVFREFHLFFLHFLPVNLIILNMAFFSLII